MNDRGPVVMFGALCNQSYEYLGGYVRPGVAVDHLVLARVIADLIPDRMAINESDERLNRYRREYFYHWTLFRRVSNGS